MRTQSNPYRVLLAAFTLLMASTLFIQPAAAQDSTPLPALAGTWVFNAKQSDSTDDKVEEALRKMGQRARRGWFERRDDVYRGGPADQELYDRISYDKLLEIEPGSDEYLFTYAGEYQRPIYLDNRSRAVSLTQLDSVEDFSMGHVENGKLLVEARPRDGGFAEETYTLLNNGTQ
ncbi:MAG: hypothetical protein ACO1PZ_14780, partial [Gammaproteobacteria bacterium]